MLPSLDSPANLVPIDTLLLSSFVPDYATGELEFDVMGSNSSLTSAESVREPVQFAADYVNPCLTQSFGGLDLPEQPVNPEALVEGEQLSPHATILSKSSAGSDEDIHDRVRKAHSTLITPGLHPVEPGNLEKLERINQLLAEAARLQQEVLY